jgi:uncharacterized delta-60 repeat protein
MIVVAGKQSTDTGANFLIARFMPNGDVDTSFGDNDSGTVVTDLGGFDSVRAIAIQKDHKIVVAGSTWFGNFQTVRGVLARYDESGNLDASFDQGLGLLCLYFHSCGKLKINLGGGMADYPDSVALRKSDGTEDGKIVVAGAFGIARFNANGTLDHDFGNSGIMDQPDNSGTAVAILANDDIVVAGTDVDNFALAIYEPSGQRCAGDSSITTDFDGPYSGANAIAIDADGKILVAGSANNGNNSDFALARYKGGKCPIVVATNFLAYHIYVPPWDLIGPPAPLFRDTRFNNLEIGLSKQLAFRTSDSATYSGAGSLGYQAFELIPSAEERKANVSASITNPLGDSSLQILEANQLLIPTEIAAEPTGSTNAPDALSLPFLKCYRAKRTVDVVALQETKSVTVTDALKRTWTIGVGEPTTFCRPIDRHGREGVSRELSLVGYEIKSINVANKSEPSRVSVANEFGARVLKLEQPEFLFLSSLVE